MTLSRRKLAALLPALAALPANGQSEVLPSRCYAFDSLKAKANEKNGMETRDVFKGKTHTGCGLALHISSLPAGRSPHPPHRHEHEEMMLVEEGTLEATVEGKSSRVGPGSVIYVNSQELHGLKNVGNDTAHYFVVEMRSS
jgi:mannose-6-phosphate isomerase-like protein (cupin superfamily)